MGNAGLGGLVWVKGDVWSIYSMELRDGALTWRGKRQVSHHPLQSSRGRALFVAVCFKGGCLRVLQLSALGRRPEVLCVQVQAVGPVSACS